MHSATRAVAVLVCLFTTVGALIAQPRVDSRNSYERCLVVLPLTGAGTLEDPVRPMFIPAPHSGLNTLQIPGTPSQSPILGYTWVPSDDGKFALTEIVMRDRAGFKGILAAPGLKVFIKGVNARADIEGEFKKYKKDFDATKFGVNVQ